MKVEKPDLFLLLMFSMFLTAMMVFAINFLI